MLYSELEDQQVAPPIYSLFWCQTYSFTFSRAFTLSLFCWRPLSFQPDKYDKSPLFTYLVIRYHSWNKTPHITTGKDTGLQGIYNFIISLYAEGAWIPNIGILNEFEYRTVWSSDFQWFGFGMVSYNNSYSYGPDHSKTKPLGIWTKWNTLGKPSVFGIPAPTVNT